MTDTIDSENWERHFCQSKLDKRWFGVAFKERVGQTTLNRWKYFIHTTWHSTQEECDSALDMIILTYGQ